MAGLSKQCRALALLTCLPVLSQSKGSDFGFEIIGFRVSSNQSAIAWRPYPAAQEYSILSSTNVVQPFAVDSSGTFSGPTWRSHSLELQRFYRLAVAPMSSNALLTANVLNRLAYGPTPDELERVTAIGPQAYIDEQLRPENIPNDLDDYVSVTTNGVTLPPITNWSLISVTGYVSSSTLLVYLTGGGDAYLDDVELRLITRKLETNNGVITTNIVIGTNVLTNGDFEGALAGNGTNSWIVSPSHAASSISTNVVCSGTGSLHIVASAPGSAQAAISQTVVPSLPTGFLQRCILSFRYLPGPHSGLLTLKLLGDGTAAFGARQPDTPTWIYATATGLALPTPSLYMYLSGAGESYIDDMKLVAGSVAEAGQNLLVNGDFESALTNGWHLSADFTNSFISGGISRQGSGSLKIVATGAGSGATDSISQTSIAGLVNGQVYTLSFWYLPTTRNRVLTVRLFGSALVAQPDRSPTGLKQRLDTIGGASVDTGAATVESFGGAHFADLRAWYCMNAVGARRQLLEILTQFLENHFVTEHIRSVDYLDRYYDDFGIMDTLATDWEYREISKWRQCLMRADCTFYDLLKISAESPAMIVALDTVDSRGNGANVPNEKYARDLLEVFCLGPGNGYDENDVVTVARAWTGWSVDIVDRANIDDPLAPRSQTAGFYPGNGFVTTSNLVGAWTFNFKTNRHGTNRAPLFAAKTVPARFGSPWAGMPYQLTLPVRTGTEGIQDGYDIIRHLADLPMTMEHISIKLCRLFVHDDFPNPTTDPELGEYAFYDYTNLNRSEEADLVHQCMNAWWNSSPRGQIRPVLNTIFNSRLFRGHGGSLQKVKTPLEFVASSVRALRSANTNGAFAAGTDGYSFASALARMGAMNLFNRAEPGGYPESGPAWISVGTLAERIRYVQALCTDPGPVGSTEAGDSFADPVALLFLKLPSTAWSNAGAVADYFLNVIFPGEGKANLDQYRTAAINFLNDGSADPSIGTRPLRFDQLAINPSQTATYDLRVRGMIAFLLATQRFQEQ